MAGRYKTASALVLRTRQSGEANREAVFLSQETGLISAVVYGGAKSKLRSYVSPYHTGTLYLYHDPVRDSYKVTDFDVLFWRLGLREQYERAVCGAAIAETIIAGCGGGAENAHAYLLANAALDALDEARGAESSRVVTHFLWQWADILGVRDSLSSLNAGRRYPGALEWLSQTQNAQPEELAALEAGDRGLSEAKALCLEVLSRAYGRRLPSWSSL